MNDSAHIARTHVQFAGNIGLGHFLGKSVHLNRNRVCNAPISNVSSLADHIPDIVCIGSKKQMVWMNTAREVAGMEHVEIVRNRSYVDDPRKAVSKNVGTTTDAYSSVALRKLRSPKEPTSIALNDSTPKSDDDGWRKSLRNQVRKTINRFRHIGLSLQRLTRLGVRYGFNRSDAAFF